MIDLGTVRPGSTIRIPWSSFDKDDGSSITATNYAAADILVYKDGSTTERASTSGFTATTDFDAKTGKHLAIIDLSDNTTVGFYAAGSEYLIAIDAVTVDAVTTGGWIARFRLGYKDSTYDTTIATLSSQTSFTLTTGPAEDSALLGCIVLIHSIASAVQHGFAVISAYTGSTKTVTLTNGVTFTAAAADNVSIFPPSNARWFNALLAVKLPLAPATAGRDLVVDAAGLADANTVKVGPTGSGTAQTARDVGASVLLSSGTGTGQLDFTTGVVKGNVTQWLGTAASTPTVAGVPNVNVKTWNDLATVALPLVPTTAGRTLDVSAGGEAGVDWANVGSPTTALALTGTTIAVTQKVDVDTIKTNPVVNGGTITFPTTATLASTTNITAGTITTTTNLTNAPTSGDFTATMKASIGTAVAASAVASVTAAVSLSTGDSPVMQSGTAAAGGASTITIQTAIGADSLPVGCKIKITSGTGAKQARVITGYVDATKVATVDRAWTTAPDNTSVYSILYDELAALSTGLKVAGVVLTDTLTTYTGNTVQTGDSFSQLGAPAGASVSVDIAAIKAETATIVGQTGTTGVKLAADSVDAAAVAATGAAEIAAAVGALTIAELAAIPSATPALKDALMLLFMALRNKRDTSATADTIANSAGTTIATATLSDDSVTFEKSRYN